MEAWQYYDKNAPDVLKERIAELESSNEQYLSQFTDVTAEAIRYRKRAGELEKELKKHEWVSVEERLPEKEGIYLTKYKGDKRQQLNDKLWIRTYPYGGIYQMNWNPKKQTKYSVTHWKPISLPSPPSFPCNHRYEGGVCVKCQEVKK